MAALHFDVAFDGGVEFSNRHRTVSPQEVVRQDRLAAVLLFRFVEQIEEDADVVGEGLEVKAFGEP